MDPLRVVLPDGVETGEEIVVTSPDGQEFTVTVPPGLTGGCEMDVDLPSAERESSPVSVTVTVFVPSGCGAGDEVTVDYEGETFGVVLPSGSSEGMPIDVELSLSHPDADADAKGVARGSTPSIRPRRPIALLEAPTDALPCDGATAPEHAAAELAPAAHAILDVLRGAASGGVAQRGSVVARDDRRCRRRLVHVHTENGGRPIEVPGGGD